MSDFAKEIVPIYIEDELKQSYLDYAMSVIVGRALPDVRDGLKPVHRRILFAMRELGNSYDKPYKKSARIVGDVIGKYHPHGESAIYDAIVRMAQPFSLRYLLVDGQGNFGSVDGDSPAAMRYTEVRMTKLAQALLIDLDKETVNFSYNYDETELIPDVLPTRVPNLLVNGASGIAVGMATNIPPHNIDEIIDACLALIANPEIEISELLDYVLGPDFPTAAIICGRSGIVQAYRTGRGQIRLRARVHFETAPDNIRQHLIVTELPYQVNKARLMEKIASLVKEKRIEGIAELRDESDKDGMRMVIVLKKGINPQLVLNNLYVYTPMQTSFGINMVALIDGQPKQLNLKQMLQAFIHHRREVVIRRTYFELGKAKQRGHYLEGLAVALVNIDEIVALIKASINPASAKEALLANVWPCQTIDHLFADHKLFGFDDSDNHYGLCEGNYKLSPQQAQAILDLKLHRLTGLEQGKIFTEYKKVLALITELSNILADSVVLMTVIEQELMEVKQQFGDKRRTEITQDRDDELVDEDLIKKEELVITLSHCDYIKSQTLGTYQAQGRGGVGKTATSLKEGDFIKKMIVANSHDMLLFFSSSGRIYWLKGYRIPQASRHSRGIPVVNLLQLSNSEQIYAILPISHFSSTHYVVMATARGLIKRVALDKFARPQSRGIIAISLNDDDKLIDVSLTDGQSDLMLLSSEGKAVRFKENCVRAMGRTARGVCGIKLIKGQSLVAVMVVEDKDTLLLATSKGYGKCVSVAAFRCSHRAIQGVIALPVAKSSDRNGRLIAALKVNSEDDELMLISDAGTLVRIPIASISVVGRSAIGVRLVRLRDNESLVGIESTTAVLPSQDKQQITDDES